MTFDGETRRSLAPPLGTRITYHLRVPDGATLSFAIARSLPDGARVTVPTSFRIRLARPSAGDDTICFEHALRPARSNKWRQHQVDLSAWAGQELLVTFETEARETGPVAYRPVWGHPLLSVGERESDQSQEPPNIVLISVDCLRPDHMGAYGYERDTTPSMDRLASDAVVFENAFASSTWTLPTHLSMLTGLPPSLHGGTKVRRLPSTVAYLPELLATASYEVAGIASWVYVSQIYGFERGYHVYRVLDQPDADQVIDGAIELLTQARNQKQFLFIHLLDPHRPYLPPLAFRTRFGPRPGDISDLHDLVADGRPPAPGQTEEIIRLYDGEVAFTDQQLGRLFEAMKALGLYERSLVILTADHGEAFFEHGHWEHTRTLFDEVIRVPLIVKWPGRADAQMPSRVTSLASQVDIFPTILRQASIGRPAPEAIDLLELTRGTASHREVLTEMTWRSPQTTRLDVALRSDQFKYVAKISVPSGQEPGPDTPRVEEMYDLRLDPAERNDLLASASPQETDHFRDLLTGFLERVVVARRAHGGEKVDLDEETLDKLESLGYVDAAIP